jgi:spermidine/putrescine transport system permease protein
LRGFANRLSLTAFLAPPLATLLALFVAPLAVMLCYSFWSVDNDYQLVTTFGVGQYRRIFADSLYAGTLGRSVALAAATTVICILIALPLAWFVVRSVSPRWRVALILALIVPGWVSVLIRTYSMNLVLGESGLLNWALISAGLISTPLGILFTKGAVVIGLVYIYIPYTFVPIYAAIERLDPAILEAAENLGADPVRKWTRITLPLIMPGILAGSVITFIPAVGEYLVPNLLGGLQGTMYGNLIGTAFQNFNWPLGAALSVVLLAGIMLALLAVSRAIDLNRSLLAE